MNHEDCLRILSSHKDGSKMTAEEDVILAAHLPFCEECQALYVNYLKIKSRLSAKDAETS